MEEPPKPQQEVAPPPEPERTQQERVQEKLESAGDQAVRVARTAGAEAQQAITETWNKAKSVGEKLVLVGGLIGLVSFFLPWQTVSLLGMSESRSGLGIAREPGGGAMWFFPVAMLAALFLTWLHLHSDTRKRILNARWLILIGAAWGWHWVAAFIGGSATMMGLGSYGFGGYLAAAGALMILVGGIIQTHDNVRGM